MTRENMAKKYGINGKHKAIGKSVQNDSFKGFTIAKIDSIEKSVSKMEDVLLKDLIPVCNESNTRSKTNEKYIYGIALAIFTLAVKIVFF